MAATAAAECAVCCIAREGLHHLFLSLPLPKSDFRSGVAWRDTRIALRARATPRIPRDSCILRPRMGFEGGDEYMHAAMAVGNEQHFFHSPLYCEAD